jgi:hypothetical protein
MPEGTATLGLAARGPANGQIRAIATRTSVSEKTKYTSNRLRSFFTIVMRR